MTPERALEILEADQVTGNLSRQMTPAKIAELERLWTRMKRSTSYQELLHMIVNGELG